jgi:hypothetical protein
MLFGLASAFAVSPAVARAQKTSPAPTAPKDTDVSGATALARAAIQKFFPRVLSDTADPGALFVILSSDGKLLNAAHGGTEDNDKLKANYEEFESKVQSMEIRTIPAGALLPRRLEVVITTFKP